LILEKERKRERERERERDEGGTAAPRSAADGTSSRGAKENRRKCKDE
jgi:hypothetical protein